MPKTIAEINERIKQGLAVVVTAEEMSDVVDEMGAGEAARKVDVVTTATFGAMCSSGVFVNFGHSAPKIKTQKVWLNDVPAYSGIAAVDLYLGAAELQQDDPANRLYPGEFRYGGGHVIEDLVAGKDIVMKATGYGTDDYPRRELETRINIKTLNEVTLFNPRNGYQNYNVAVNLTDRPIYTYMGLLRPRMGNATYSSAGQLSPLFNDPFYETIGIGTRIFLGGGVGYVAWWGTQHDPGVDRLPNGIPRTGAGTLATIGDAKQMDPYFLRGTSMRGYGVTLTVGIGIPIPVLNERIARFTAVRDRDIVAPVVDYGRDYPNRVSRVVAEVTYEELRSGSIAIEGKEIPTGGISSYRMARRIAGMLKEWIEKAEFLLTEPVAKLPGSESGYSFKPLRERKA